MSDQTSILKPNATVAERALEQAMQTGKADLSPVAALLNPETCPAHLLGWLAWTLSVDSWDASWPEAVKREVIAQSVDVHRRKGTAGSVKKALASLGMEARISEWFEYGGAPGTFQIDVLIEEVFAAGFNVSPALLADVERVLQNTKPVSAQYSIRLGERTTTVGQYSIGFRESSKDTAAIGPDVPVFALRASLPVATGLRDWVMDRMTITPQIGGAA